MSDSQPQPPPVPPKVATLKYKTFEGTSTGLKTADFDRRRLAEAQVEAAKWINSQRVIEVVSIDSTIGDMLAAVTVWYR